MTPLCHCACWHEMKMAKKRPGMATLKFTSFIVCAVLLGQGSPEKTGECTTKKKKNMLLNIIFLCLLLHMLVT